MGAQPVTEDYRGRLRIPPESASLLPSEDGDVENVLRGVEATATWQTVLAGDGDGLGSLTLDPSLLGRLAESDDSLIITEGPEDRIYID